VRAALLILSVPTVDEPSVTTFSGEFEPVFAYVKVVGVGTASTTTDFAGTPSDQLLFTESGLNVERVLSLE
jgi:hypothetical protein